MKENTRLVGITGIVEAGKVRGQKQECESEFFDHAFVDQQAYFEDDYFGTVYLPLPNNANILKWNLLLHKS